MKFLIILFLLITGCSSLVPGNYVNTRLITAIPSDKSICMRSAFTSPTALNANDSLIAELVKIGLPMSCESPLVIAVWSYQVGDKKTSTLNVPGSGSASSAMSCAGGACSGSSSSSYTAGHSSTSVSYGRSLLLNVYEQNSLPDNPLLHWSIELTSRGEITQLNKLMEIWAPVIASNWGQSVSNEFVPNSGLNIILD